MKRINTLELLLLGAALLVNGAAVRAETIQQGILSISAGAPTTPVPGTIDSGYVTAIFGNAAFLQDASGAVYLQYGAEAASGTFFAGPFNGMPVGTQFTMLSGGGFELYTAHNQFEYAGTGTIVSNTAGTIPASYFTLTTTSGLANNAGGTDGSTITQGIQSQLVTINNATILTSAGVAPAPGATFTAGKYLIKDSTGTSTLYINSGLTDVIGQPIPTGNVKVSGVFDEYNSTTQELEPRGMSDFAAASAVPEPSSGVLAAIALAVVGVGVARRQRI